MIKEEADTGVATDARENPAGKKAASWNLWYICFFFWGAKIEEGTTPRDCS